MKAELTDLSETRKNIAVEIPTSAVDSEIERLSRHYRRSIKMPGFRPGKAPPKLVRQRFRDQILSEVAQDLIPKAVDEAIRERGLEPVDTPSIRDVNVEEGHPLTFIATFETLPPVDPGEYRQLTLCRPPVEITDEAVVEAMEALRQRLARLETTSGRAITHGDTVTVDLVRQPVSPTDAETPEDAETHEHVDVEIGGGTNPPGFDEQLIGLDVGTTRKFTVHFPDDHAATELAGTDVAYTATVKVIRERVPPDLDDKFARDLGTFETLDSLTAQVREDLGHQAEHEADAKVRDELIRQLAARVENEVPETLISGEIDRRIEHFVSHLISQHVDPRHANIDWDAFRKEQRAPASATVRSTLIIDEISKRESINVEDAEVEKELERQAERSGRTASTTRALLEKEGGLNRFVRGLRREKTIDFLLTKATIVTA